MFTVYSVVSSYFLAYIRFSVEIQAEKYSQLLDEVFTDVVEQKIKFTHGIYHARICEKHVHASAKNIYVKKLFLIRNTFIIVHFLI